MNGPVRLTEFTQQPSKTNYSYILKQMKLMISKEEASTVANFQLMIDNPLNDHKATLQKLQEEYIPSVQDSLWLLKGIVFNSDEINEGSSGVIDNLLANKNSIVPYEGDFVNLVKVDLLTLKPEAFKGCAIDPENVTSYLSCLSTLFGYGYFNGFFHSVTNNVPFDNNSAAVYHGTPVTIIELIKFFQSDVTGHLDNVKMKAEEAIRYTEEIQDESDKHKDNHEMIMEFINKKLVPLQEHFCDVANFVHLVNDLSKLVWLSSNLIKFYKTL